MTKGIQQIQENSYQLLYDNRINVRNSYTITIVTPNYNRGILLQNMLASVRHQDFDLSLIELVIVDDGGEAKEIEMIKTMRLPFRIRYFWQEHFGRRVGRSRNIAVKNALGEIIIFLDSDALLSPLLLKDHYTKHERKRKLFLLGDMFDLKQGDKPKFRKILGQDCSEMNIMKFMAHVVKREFILPLVYSFFNISKGLCFCTLHASAKKEHLIQVNGFDEGLDGRWGDEDLEIGYRLEKSGLSVRWTGGAFVYHQWHPISIDLAGIDNRMRMFMNHPETITIKKIGGLVNPFTHCTLDDIKAIDKMENVKKTAEPEAKTIKSGTRYKILFDNKLNSSLQPELSVIIPTYNKEDFVKDFLLSMESQTIEKNKFEVIIADDGGDPAKSLEIIKNMSISFQLIYIWQEDRGYCDSSNKNNAVNVSRGAIIINTDIDVVVPSNFLNAHYAAHQSYNSVALAGLAYYLRAGENLSMPVGAGNNPFFYKSWRFRGRLFIEKIRQNYFKYLSAKNELSLGTCVSSINASFKRKDYDCAGGFDETLDGVWGDQDIEFSLRLEKQGTRIEFLNDTIVYHRWHSYAVMRNYSDENRLLFLIKHQGLLKHKIINTRVNTYYNNSIAEIRCFYVWKKRLRLINKLPPANMDQRVLKEKIRAFLKILLPAFFRTVFNVIQPGSRLKREEKKAGPAR